MTRREIAVAFLQAVTSGDVRTAYERYVHAAFRHHNPYFQSDREALLRGMEESAAMFPQKEFRVLRTLEDGDLVAVHGRLRLQLDMPEHVLVHILRFEGDMIIEEWEAGQEVPPDCPNANGVF